MEETKITIQKPQRASRAAKQTKQVEDAGSFVQRKPLLKQGSTWAGIFSIAAAVASGGATALTDPTVMTTIGAGIALLFAEN